MKSQDPQVVGVRQQHIPEQTAALPNNEKQAPGQANHHEEPRGLSITKHQLEAWYRTYILELIFRQKPLPPSKNGRCIPLDLRHDSPLIDERRGHAYISNTIRTSRYTLWDFIPKQLLFQFTRLSNFYFLCIGVPQTIPGLSTTGTYTTILPLLFFVLLMIAKEGYDDYRRHRLDKVENARPTTVLRKVGDESAGITSTRWALFGRGKHNLPGLSAEEQGEPVNGYRWTQVHWRDVKVGDIVKLARDDDVPADMVLLYATGEHGIAYIETMAIDGETNLKSRQVSVALSDCSTIETIDACKAEFVLEDPNPELYRFDGRITAAAKTLPLTLNEIIYRGSTLRNTKCALGMVINTGEECKIRMNANRHPKAKKPALEKVANRIVMSLILYVILLTAGCSIGYLLWQRSVERDSFYLVNAAVEWQEIIIGFAIQFNNLIALAMYVSLEIVRLGQMFMLYSDVGMYDEATDTPARCNTNTILENLGQVGYVFSDKTGTLTENVMKFKKLSIAGTAWLHETGSHGENMVTARRTDDGGFPFEADTSATGHTSAIPEDAELDAVSPGTLASPALLSPGQTSSFWRRSTNQAGVLSERTTADLLEYIRLRPESQLARTALEYILALALCHTCLPEIKDDGEVEFQAASPDELALVKAAQELGFLVVQRSTHRTTVRMTVDPLADAARDEEYEILDVVEFSSKRKRMSVIVRCPDGRIWLICKGADSVLLPRLKMAHLAMQKANEVRESAEMDREMQRKSEQRESRVSIGARASLTMRRSLGITRENSASTKRPTAMRSQSLEASKLRKSGDLWRPTASRAFSYDVSKQQSGNSSQPPLPDKFALLEESVPQEEGEVFTKCFQHLDDFAAEGLRTLLFAHKYIPENDYTIWKKLFLDATTSLTNRQERIEVVGEMIEQEFVLLGATAIEDKLQKGVPETIEKLRRANIKIWMLTGDKRETAINIAHSARICKPASDIFILDSTKGDLEKQISNIIEDLQLREEGILGADIASPHTVVVIDGHTLSCIEASPPLQHLFYALIPTIDSVICCRASPAQKALLVRTIRHAPRSPLFSRQKRHPGLTLAIGDGANDLAMLAEAHVGIGISGREGLQAARVADYAIAQFRFLSRLLLLHGRWNYVRTARFILATFWKEMFFYTGTIVYQRFNGYTGTSLYEMWSLTILNTIFTSLPVIIPGVWEKDLSETTLLAVPELYVHGQRGRELYAGRYVGWMLAAAAEGVIMYFGCWAGYHVFGEPSDWGLFAIGNLVFSVAMMWTNIKLMLIETHYKTPILLGCFALSIAGWWIWQCVLAGIYAQSPSPYAVTKGFFRGFGRDLAWWLTCIVVLSVLVVIELVWKALERSRPARAVRRAVRRTLKLWSRKGKKNGTGVTKAGVAGVATAAEADGRGTETALAAAEDEWDPALWQVLEQDPLVRQRLELINEAEELGIDDGEVDDVLEGRGGG